LLPKVGGFHVHPSGCRWISSRLRYSGRIRLYDDRDYPDRSAGDGVHAGGYSQGVRRRVVVQHCQQSISERVQPHYFLCGVQ